MGSLAYARDDRVWHPVIPEDFYRGKARRVLIDLRGVDRTFPEVND